MQSCDEIAIESEFLSVSVSYFKAGLFLHTRLLPTSSKLWLGYSFRYDCLASPNASETAPASELSLDQFPTACD